MYQSDLDMSLTDFAVKCAIRILTEEPDLLPDGKETISADDIATHIGCSASTVRRTLPRLIEAGSVVRYGSKRAGYRYEVKGDKRNARSQ